MKGMTLRAMTQAVNGIYHGEDYDKEITAITIDSRKVAEGGLFIAIKGERSDGHDFIGQCFEKGAACVISEKELPDEERSYIQVESSLQALKDLALLYRNNLDVKVVGITGIVHRDNVICRLRRRGIMQSIVVVIDLDSGIFGMCQFFINSNPYAFILYLIPYTAF